MRRFRACLDTQKCTLRDTLNAPEPLSEPRQCVGGCMRGCVFLSLNALSVYLDGLALAPFLGLLAALLSVRNKYQVI